MGRATIGESGADKAMNRMEKHMERSARREENNPTPRKPKENPIIAQLKELCPDTWEAELAEMRKEAQNPDYLKRKNEARAQFKLDYYKMVPQHERAEMSENRYVSKRLAAWKLENA